MKRHPLLTLVLRWGVLALGVTLATNLITGIHCNDLGTLLVVVALLSFFNAILKPMLVAFALPFVVATLGLGLWIINALLFYLVSALVPSFHVDSFGAALGGAAIVSLTSIFMGRLFDDNNRNGGGGRGGPGGPGSMGPRRRNKPPPPADVIDV